MNTRFAEPRCWTGVVFQPLAHRNVSDGSDARVKRVIIFQLFFVLILLKRSERTEREECVTCMFLWCPGMFLRGVLKVGDGGLEESANKQVAGGDGGEMPIFVLRQATQTQQMHSTTPLWRSRVVVHATEKYTSKPTWRNGANLGRRVVSFDLPFFKLSSLLVCG